MVARDTIWEDRKDRVPGLLPHPPRHLPRLHPVGAYAEVVTMLLDRADGYDDQSRLLHLVL
jgi:hypothetical protein